MGLLRAGVLLILMMVLVACSATPPAVTQAKCSPDAEHAGVVARVNGVDIPEATYLRELERRRGNSNIASEEALCAEVLETLIRQELINQGAASVGVNVTDANVDIEYQSLRDFSNSEEEWAQFLATNNYTDEEMRAAQRDVLTTQGVQTALLSPYLGEIEQVNARHIVVQTRAEAEDILDRLSAGEGFASLAAAHSRDTTTAEIGGNLGWFARNELFYSNLEDIAFQLEIGEVAGPIATSLGYHVIQTMDKASRPIEPERLPMLSESVFGSWLDEQYRNAVIERYI